MLVFKVHRPHPQDIKPHDFKQLKLTKLSNEKLLFSFCLNGPRYTALITLLWIIPHVGVRTGLAPTMRLANCVTLGKLFTSLSFGFLYGPVLESFCQYLGRQCWREVLLFPCYWRVNGTQRGSVPCTRPSSDAIALRPHTRTPTHSGSFSLLS